VYVFHLFIIVPRVNHKNDGLGPGVEYVMNSSDFCYTHDWTVTEEVTIQRGFPLEMPGPGLSLKEKRNHLVEALRHWMCGPEIIAMIDDLIGEDVDPNTICDDIDSGIFPVGRLYLVIRRLDAFSGVWGVRDVCLLCYGICVAALENKECPFNDDIKDLVLGFLDRDLLPTGETLRSVWNQSPFDPLRNAEPLPEDEEEEEDEKEEDEEEFVQVPQRSSLDDQFDTLFCSLSTYSAVCLAFLVSYCIAIVQSGGIPKF
jgi:hypothetical protein